MSAKNLDKHNRWRNKTVAFRVSPEEDAQIETAVKLTGLTKQDYIIRRLLCRDVVVQGNPRVYKALRDQLATVLALPDKNGDVLVRAGIIKTKVPLKGLKQPDKLIKEPQPKTKAQQRYSRLTGDANRPNGRVERVQRSAKMELNLLGLTVDEALPEVDAYIDRAILNGQTVVYLIHGNGTGALRTAIHKHLRGNRMVKSFRLGRYGEGESGVTVVELK